MQRKLIFPFTETCCILASFATTSCFESVHFSAASSIIETNNFSTSVHPQVELVRMHLTTSRWSTRYVCSNVNIKPEIYYYTFHFLSKPLRPSFKSISKVIYETENDFLSYLKQLTKVRNNGKNNLLSLAIKQ